MKGRRLKSASAAPPCAAPGSLADTSWLRPSSGRLLLVVKVVPGASRTRLGGLRDGALLARVAAPPEKGKANDELVTELARSLGIAKSEVEIVSGASSRRKTLSIPASAESRIRSLAESSSA